jgi:hypothetical protein
MGETLTPSPSPLRWRGSPVAGDLRRADLTPSPSPLRWRGESIYGRPENGWHDLPPSSSPLYRNGEGWPRERTG